MLGKKLKKRRENKISNLEILLMKMEAALENGNFEELPELVTKFREEFDRQLKGSFITQDTLVKFQKILKYLEEKANKKKEELIKKEQKIKTLKSYGEFG